MALKIWNIHKLDSFCPFVYWNSLEYGFLLLEEYNPGCLGFSEVCCKMLSIGVSKSEKVFCKH